MNDKADWLNLVKVEGLMLAEAPDWAQDEDEVVAAAVSSNPDALEFASARLRASGRVVNAVSQDGLTLRHALGAARRDRDICRQAVYQNGFALEFVPDELRSTRDVALTAVRNCAGAAAFISLDSLASDGFAESVAECDPATINYLPAEIAAKREVTSAAARGRLRISTRRLEEDAVKALCVTGLAKGVLLHQDIVAALPGYALSEHEIAQVADSLEYENGIAVYASERDRESPESSLAWRRAQVFKQFHTLFPVDD